MLVVTMLSQAMLVGTMLVGGLGVTLTNIEQYLSSTTYKLIFIIDK